MNIYLLVIILVLQFSSCFLFQFKSFSIAKYSLKLSSTSNEKMISENLKSAMMNARKNQISNKSPGSGLGTADEQSDAAYADLINTSIDYQGKELSEADLHELAKGSHMWENNAKKKVRHFNPFKVSSISLLCL